MVPQGAILARRALENCFVIGYTLSMSATVLMKEIQSLPAQERERIFEFVLRFQKPDWATPKPPGYFAEGARSGRNRGVQLVRRARFSIVGDDVRSL